MRVGEVSHLRNLEYVLVCGEPDTVERVTAPYADAACADYADAAISRPRSRSDGVAAPSVNSVCFTQRK